MNTQQQKTYSINAIEIDILIGLFTSPVGYITIEYSTHLFDSFPKQQIRKNIESLVEKEILQETDVRGCYVCSTKKKHLIDRWCNTTLLLFNNTTRIQPLQGLDIEQLLQVLISHDGHHKTLTEWTMLLREQGKLYTEDEVHRMLQALQYLQVLQITQHDGTMKDILFFHKHKKLWEHTHNHITKKYNLVKRC